MSTPAAPASEGIPEIPMSDGDDMADVLEILKLKIAELEAKLNVRDNPVREYDDFLKPIDITKIWRNQKSTITTSRNPTRGSTISVTC